MDSDIPLMDAMVRRVGQLRRDTGVSRTLLAVCPNSKNVIRAVFRSAKRHRAPVIFAATLNQVDLDGGYTGMTHHDFAAVVRNEADVTQFEGPVFMAMDHGGPWQKDLHRREKWSFHQTMDAVTAAMEAAVDAGFGMIHVDPTLDMAVAEGRGPVMEQVVARTISLIHHAETHRRRRELPPLSYEVGTEEINGGLTDPCILSQFLASLRSGLAARHLTAVWPVFVVGNVGTDLHSTAFNRRAAEKLVAAAGRFGSVIKGHYTDFVADPRLYPAAGMGGANVGPEFSLTEYLVFSELCDLEEPWRREGRIERGSGLKRILEKHVVESGRWKKWRLPHEKEYEFRELPEERRQWLIGTGCRYIWERTEVVAARERLYENCRRNGIAAGERVIDRLERNMDKYFTAFNLPGLNDLLSSALSS